MKPRMVATRAAVARRPATSEPTSEMPEMALVADMSGVCSSGGTRVMTMKPDEAGQHEDVELDGSAWVRRSVRSPGDDGSRRGRRVIAPVISSVGVERQRAVLRERCCERASSTFRPNIWLAWNGTVAGRFTGPMMVTPGLDDRLARRG